MWVGIRFAIFTGGQFWPSGIVIASVSVCINHLLLCMITIHLFNMQSPNLDQTCKTPWLRFLLFWGKSTLIFKAKFKFKVKIYPILSLSIHNSSAAKPRITKFRQKIQNILVKIPIFIFILFYFIFFFFLGGGGGGGNWPWYLRSHFPA